MKKIFLIILLVSFIFLAFQVWAACPTEGLVPCGTTDCPCQFCHFFVMLDRIIDFVLFKIVPPLAVLMIVIGGIMFFFAGGSPATLARAKSILTSAVIGLLIIYSAWLIIGLFLQAIGLADWTKEIYKNWWQEGFFQFNCPIK